MIGIKPKNIQEFIESLIEQGYALISPRYAVKSSSIIAIKDKTFTIMDKELWDSICSDCMLIVLEEALPSLEDLINASMDLKPSESIQANFGLQIVADYFNKDWEKTLNNVGYFIYSYDGQIKTGKHTIVKYPGLVYFKEEDYISIAKEILGEELINNLFI